MLSQQRVIRAFEDKQTQFRQYAESLAAQSAAADDWLSVLEEEQANSIIARLQELNIEWPGAIPTLELDQAAGLCIPFTEHWQHHPGARLWARSVLEKRPTIAVDGSQITPAVEYSLPIGAVQIGWFINPHSEDRPYIKDLHFEVLGPEELREDEESGEESFAVQTVNQKRFVRECMRLEELILEYRHLPEMLKPVCFFDGSFIISFAGKIQQSRARTYIDAVRSLLAAAEDAGVPLVGFVDTSLSRDLVTLISVLDRAQSHVRALSDGALVRRRLPHWGDRTALFECARMDGLSANNLADFYTEVLFTYMNLAADRPPARIEIPRWIYEAGRADEILDIVRAECVVGAGYPYAIETADALAVIGYQDRQRFYRLFQQFAQQSGLSLSMSRKLRSKQSRR